MAVVNDFFKDFVHENKVFAEDFFGQNAAEVFDDLYI